MLGKPLFDVEKSKKKFVSLLQIVLERLINEKQPDQLVG
jgi:hypothetical protein